MNILFVCNQGLHRSRTAKEVFSAGFSTKSAGLHNNQPLEAKSLAWADIVFVMVDRQREEIAERFPKEYLRKKILALGILDVYSYDQPELRQVIRSRVGALLPA